MGLRKWQNSTNFRHTTVRDAEGLEAEHCRDLMTFCSSVLGTDAVDVAPVAALWQDTCQVLVHVVITKQSSCLGYLSHLITRCFQCRKLLGW